ncbi:phosphatase PAP2 family protein [Longibacter salinarum]|uniref:phosphatase PAP2 family protein n=1 Tax=Longibacter salinarum TaxID=1850348 RepID=UPI001C54F1F0|nr:phosphatase PAP2 family protein [Longibacter salinarum]
MVTTPLTLAHKSAYPVFYGGLPAAWIGVWAIRGSDDFTDVYRLTVTQGATFLTVTALKRLFGRPRPFMTVAGVRSRSASYGRSIDDGQFASLPSGHASLSVALATSWSLSHPYWYVIAPAAVWAGGVSLSRPYLGVHYPSDILFGAVLGAGIAVAVHLLRGSITPAVFKPNDPAAIKATGPKVSLLKVTF